MAKIGHYAKAMAHAKCLVWVQNLNSQKHAKNDSTMTLELLCVKNGSNKKLIFEK